MSLRQIAKLAGVSCWTVSLTLRGSTRISAATKQRVLKHAKRLGYRPNPKVTELMSQVRLKRERQPEACFGVFSFYDSARPWEESVHFSRIYKGMTQRAESLGYRLEPFWLNAPGMTARRFRGVLDARGIQGLLCFGSPNVDEEFPRELDHYAVVTQGLSIKTPLHRVIHNVSNDMWRVLSNLQNLGYRRPGLVIGDREGARSAHAYMCVYLGWSQLVLGTPSAIPVLHLKEVEEKPLLRWVRRYQPDVLIYIHYHTTLATFAAILHQNGIRVPGDLGVAVLSQILDDTDFSGMESNQQLLGAWAVELLVGRIVNCDCGIPSQPRVEMIDCQWIVGKSLRPQHG